MPTHTSGRQHDEGEVSSADSDLELTYPQDSTGYRPTDRDLQFLGVSVAQLGAMSSKAVPLGMSAGDYEKFVSELVKAATLDGIIRIDVRLKGSSGRFFSGRHKQMAYDRHTVARYIRQTRRDFAESLELDAIMDQLTNI